jgi:hypothetical protein
MNAALLFILQPGNFILPDVTAGKMILGFPMIKMTSKAIIGATPTG